MKSTLKKWSKLFILPLAVLFGAADNDLVTFTIHNDSNYTIYKLFISNSDETGWGEDRLGSTVISPGDDWSTLIYPSSYDIKVQNSDGDYCTKMSVNINNDVSWRISQRELDNCWNTERVEFTIRNNSDWSIYYVYMSAPSEGWGDDHLGSNTISANGGTFTLRLRPGTYDLKMQDEDGDECIQMGFTINSDMTWSFGNSEWLDCINE